MWRLAVLLLVACGHDPSPGPHGVAVSDRVREACEQQNKPAAFKHCPHWRMAMESACGSSAQPQELDPCQCMCDLCETDADCGKGRCVMISSVMLGGYDQKACVQPGGPCFPDGTCKHGQVCRDYDGHPQCEPPGHL
jgi:hypothetical protein